MKIQRPFAFWAFVVAWIWLGGFILIGGTFMFAFFVPFSPSYNSQNFVEVLRSLEKILNNYLPYLGIIFGAFFLSLRNPAWKKRKVNTNFSVFIVILSLFFNFLVFMVLLGNLLDRGNNLPAFQNIFSVLNTGFAFFMALLLSHFYSGN